MGEPAKRDVVEVPADAFERMLAELAKHNELAARQTQLLAQIVQTEERRLAQVEDNARRAARKVGPTTPEIEARVRAKMERWK